MPKHLLLSILVSFLSIAHTFGQGTPSPLQVIGIDLDNNKKNTPANWNNANRGSGSTIEDLQNQQGQPTGYAMEVTAAFNGSGMGGLSTGDNSGPVPDAVMSTFWYKQNGTATFKFTLDNTKRYRFRFYGGRDGNNDDKSSDYGIGDVTVTLYNWNNVHNEAVIDNVFPGANGEVTVSVKNTPGYTYAILNAITIEEYATGNVPPVLTAVANQTVAVGDVLSIPLSATDADGDPLAFSISGTADFVSLADHGDGTAAIAVSPSAEDIGAYEVTVGVSDGKGGESSITIALTVLQQDANVPLQVIGIDFSNTQNSTPTGWNNTNSRGVGSTIDNLGNLLGQPTGYAMEVTAAFNGASVSGLGTGDDSGPVPDAVMGTFWFRGNGTASLKLMLDNSKQYRFRFYGGRDGNNDDKSSDYSIGDVTVTLYNWNNIYNEAVIDNVVPNANGEVHISVKNSSGYMYAILNAITIEEYPGNSLPVIAAVVDQTVTVGNVLSIPLSATDVDGDSLAFSVSDGPAFISLATLGDTTAVLHVSPQDGDEGTYNIAVGVSDGKGGEDSVTFVLTVGLAVVLVPTPPVDMVRNRPVE